MVEFAWDKTFAVGPGNTRSTSAPQIFDQGLRESSAAAARVVGTESTRPFVPYWRRWSSHDAAGTADPPALGERLGAFLTFG